MRDETRFHRRRRADDDEHPAVRREGVDEGLLASLPLLGLSSLCNLVAAIKTARYYDMDARDVIFVPLTDAMNLYE